MKSIKKKESNSDTSKLADEIIKKWKSIVASNESLTSKKSSSNIQEEETKTQNGIYLNGHNGDKSKSTSNLNNESHSNKKKRVETTNNNFSARVNMYAETEDEALTKIMSSKHSKPTLYTGKNSLNSAKLVVPKLYDLCVKRVIRTLDNLHVRLSAQNKFSIIKPVLEKADAKQLTNIEKHCPVC